MTQKELELCNGRTLSELENRTVPLHDNEKDDKDISSNYISFLSEGQGELKSFLRQEKIKGHYYNRVILLKLEYKTEVWSSGMPVSKGLL